MKISGKVIKGKNRGKKLGFPTANIKLGKKIESGVYKGKVITREFNNSRMGANGKRMRANVWNAGIFVGPNRQVLEAHLIGFTGDLYGKEIEIEIEKKIREVIRFENDEKLREQIRKDINNILANESE